MLLTSATLYQEIVSIKNGTPSAKFATCLAIVLTDADNTLDASLAAMDWAAMETTFNATYYPTTPLTSANLYTKILLVKNQNVTDIITATNTNNTNISNGDPARVTVPAVKSFVMCLGEVYLDPQYSKDPTLGTVSYSTLQALFDEQFSPPAPPPPPTLTYSNIFDTIVAYREAHANDTPVPTFDQCLVAVYNDRSLIKDSTLSQVSYSFLAASFKLKFLPQSTNNDLTLSEIKQIFVPDIADLETTPTPGNYCTCACCQATAP